MKVWPRSVGPHAPRWARTVQEYQRPSFKRHGVEGGRIACPSTGAVLQRHERFHTWSPHSFRSVTIVAMLACGGVMTEECAAVERARRRSLWSHGYRHKGSDGALRHRPTRYGSSDES